MLNIDFSSKKLFIFDWDGTLADTIELISSCLVDSFKELKFPELSEEAARSIIGMGLVEAFKVLTPGSSEEDRNLLLKSYKKFFLERSNNGITLFPEVDSMLAYLQNRGLKTAIATGKSRVGLDRDFKNTGIGIYIDTTRTIDECNPKPDPHMILDIIQELGISQNETLMIGDTTYDLEMAANAGVESIGISSGAHSLQKLEACNPLKIFPDFQEFHKFLQSK